jgi:hypothetical protein
MKIKQIIKEYETPALDAVDATDTYAPPSKGYAIRVLGPLGQRSGTPAATLWYGLTELFPRDYPPANFQSYEARPSSPQSKILDTINSQGSAVIKSGIASRDLAETLAYKLAKFRVTGFDASAGPIPMSNIQVISQDLNEVSSPPVAPDPQNYDSDVDYYNDRDADPIPPDTDADYENMNDAESDDWFDESKEKIGNMDADAFDAALSRMKKLAGAGPLRTVYDPARRVYKNVPHAVQPAQQPKKAR